MAVTGFSEFTTEPKCDSWWYSIICPKMVTFLLFEISQHADVSIRKTYGQLTSPLTKNGRGSRRIGGRMTIHWLRYRRSNRKMSLNVTSILQFIQWSLPTKYPPTICKLLLLMIILWVITECCKCWRNTTMKKLMQQHRNYDPAWFLA